MQTTLIERLFWHTAERDDSKVAQHLFCRKEMDTVYTLDEATLRDKAASQSHTRRAPAVLRYHKNL